tara:strand:- start:123 stop:821 length:699 start_codon:yes stop_codon:yes gene_type:complete
MSREAKILIFSLVLCYSIYNHQNDSSIFDWDTEKTETTKGKKINPANNKRNKQPTKITPDQKVNPDLSLPKEIKIPELKLLDKPDLPDLYLQPDNGFSPYDDYFGKGVYDNSTGNSFKIKNSNSTDAVVLLVNAYSNKKVRNEFIRKGDTFEMTGVPHGTYYLEWASGTNWSPKLKVGRLTGGFQRNASFTRTRDRNDWMKVDGNKIWTVTLYSVKGGDVESESLSASEFGN